MVFKTGQWGRKSGVKQTMSDFYTHRFTHGLTGVDKMRRSASNQASSKVMGHRPDGAVAGIRPFAHQRARGVVLIITLLAILLIAGLLAYVMNLGDQVGKKIETQNAADSSAIAGATWVARSMNGVALNNVSMARNIALINVLDSIPLAIDFSLTEIDETKLADNSAMFLALNYQIERGFANLDLRSPEKALLQREFTKAREAIGEPGAQNQDRSDEAMLRQMDEYFRRNPSVITNMTFYNPPGGSGRGQIWKALAGLDSYSRSLVQGMGQLAQVAAVEAGEANLPDVEGAGAFIAPVLPAIPTKRGNFNDFQRPVLSGLLPEDVDNTRTNRGPWDTVYGFRWRQGGGGGGHSRHGRDYLADPPGWQPPTPPSEATHPSRYTVFGTQEAQIRAFARVEEAKYYTRLGAHVRNIARIKAGYIWPKRNDSNNDTLQRINKPDWEVDIEVDNERSVARRLSAFREGDQDLTRERMDENFNILPLVPAELNPQPNTVYGYGDYQNAQRLTGRNRIIKETMFMVLDVYHADEFSDFNPEMRYVGRADRNRPTNWFIQLHGRFHGRLSMTTRNGWANPEGNRPPIGRLRSNIVENPNSIIPQDDPLYRQVYPMPRTSDYSYKRVSTGRRDIYKETVRYETNPFVPQGRFANGAFPELGIPAQAVGETFIGQGANRVLVTAYKAQPYYRTRFIFLVGVNVGPDILVRDPYTGFNPAGADAPAPTDLDHSLIGADVPDRQRFLSVLAVAKQPAKSTVWASKFKNNEPFPYLTALAQAKVFNNHSWDLWTQMWHAQLEPVSNLERWAQLMQAGGETDITIPGLDPQSIIEASDFLDNIKQVSEPMISH